jgi:hypothetical protein
VILSEVWSPTLRFTLAKQYFLSSKNSAIDMPALTQTQSELQTIIEGLVNHAYDKAKRWAGLVILLQSILFLAGVAAIILPSFTLSYPWIALPLALVGAWMSGQAAKFKGMAEQAKRQHEYLAGFGMTPSRGILADLRVSLARELPEEADRLLCQGITYSSGKPPGAARVLENLCESGWFTKHLANWCACSLRALFLITVTIAISLLLLSATSLSGASVGIVAARFVAATLTFLISIGTIRFWLAYAALSKKAGDIDAEASRLLEAGKLDAFEAQRLLAEYQLTRASAPFVPTWVWRLRRDILNKHWELKRPQG